MRQDEDETPKIAEVYSKLYTNGFAPVPSALASTEQLRAVLQLMDDLETTEWWRGRRDVYKLPADDQAGVP